jgi:hypothetical protein
LLHKWESEGGDAVDLHNVDFIKMFVRDRRALTDKTDRQFWVGAYEFAATLGGGKLEDVRAGWGEWCATRRRAQASENEQSVCEDADRLPRW